MADAGVAPRSLRGNLVWTAFGNAALMVTQWATLSLLAKATSPEAVGRYTWALALTAPVVATSMMGLRQVAVTDARGEHRDSDLFALRGATSALAAVVIAVLAWTRCATTPLRALVAVVGVARIAEAMSDIAYASLQRAERMDLVARSLTIKAASSLVLLGAALLLTRDVFVAAVALAAVSVATLLRYDLPTSFAERPASHRGAARLASVLHLARTAAPVTVGLLLTTTAAALPRHALVTWRSEREAGFYAASAAVLSLIAFVPGALTQATLARAARHHAMGEHREFLRLGLRVTAISLAVALAFVGGAALVGHLVLRVAFTRDYTHLRGELVVFSLSQAVAAIATVGTQLMASARWFGLQTLNAAIALVALYVATHALVPTLGVRGSAWAEVIRSTSATVLPTILALHYIWKTRRT